MKPMSQKQPITRFDVIVAGGGPAGCTMAALLGKAGLSVACIDRDNPAQSLNPAFDTRTTAISYGSRTILQKAGAWDGLQSLACPIRDIKITDNGSPTLLRFLSDDVQAEAFGWVIENRHLRGALFKAMKETGAIHIAPAAIKNYTVGEHAASVDLEDGRTLSAELVIGADGRASFTRAWMGTETRGWSYNQRAVVSVIRHEHPHNNIAVEDFRDEGPFAILPMPDDEQGHHRSALVWTEHGPEKQSALHWRDDIFNAAIAERFPAEYGHVCLHGKRASYPLSLSHAQEYTAQRMVLVADAAHGIHPIAGQGLNIGLRDVAALADILISARNDGRDIGGADILAHYERARRPDNMAMAAATDALNKLFSNKSASLRILRRAGLRMVEKLPRTKRFFMRYAMGIGGLATAEKEKRD